jgi:hypothetical protein
VQQENYPSSKRFRNFGTYYPWNVNPLSFTEALPDLCSLEPFDSNGRPEDSLSFMAHNLETPCITYSGRNFFCACAGEHPRQTYHWVLFVEYKATLNQFSQLKREEEFNG